MTTRSAAIGPYVVAGAMVVAAVVLVVAQKAVRPIEASVSAALVDLGRIAPARSLGTAVVFPLRGAFVGYTLSAGCTAALLISPFCLFAAVLVAVRRTSIRRGVSTLVTLAVALFLVNQFRLLVVALSMRWWGFRRGYELSHVLLGTVVSTIGVLAGLVVFLRTIVDSDDEKTETVG